ncbi:hypothetical protein PIB30_066053 [Stylosanthes scabra]|uniref:AAA+ ATPase domain-containing protein n=1 Tax=Stylosanthes scabra TaxID=79078 RepID=A0ABU6ZL06_9FABA|nr:hypothetical protein [Stylosanthes scabra]
MEQKHVLLSALSVGVGLGVGLGLRSGNKWVGGGNHDSDELLEEQIVQELKKLIIDGKNSKVTFDEFPYYLSEKTRVLLTSAGYVHLKQQHFSKHMRNLSPVSRAILLTGPAEIYQQMLVKALAHFFESKLLLLDITEFSLKMQSKYGCSRKESCLKRSLSEVTMERMSGLFSSFSLNPSASEARASNDDIHDVSKGTHRRQRSSGLENRQSSGGGNENLNNAPNLRRTSSSSCDISSTSLFGPNDSGSSKRTNYVYFDEKLFVLSLYKVLVSVSETSAIVLYIRDVDKLFLRLPRMYSMLQRLMKKLTGSVLILGSQVVDSDYCKEVDERLGILFPYNIEIKPPQDETQSGNWKAQLEEDMKVFQFQDNRNHIAEDPEYRNGKLVLSAKSLCQALNLFQEGKVSGKDNTKPNETKDDCGEDASGAKNDAQAPEKSEAEKSNPVVTKKDGENSTPSKAAEAPPDNEFEKRIRPEVIPANEIGVTFGDIGALDDIKESLQEAVMLPLRRPDLFKGGLLKPCRGILLFGPPGTGKTMLAKAIANEAGASFINVSMSTITSKWFGEDEKNVRALFTLAAKVAPTIVFVDEVDSMLGQRSRAGEHEAMRKIKNEFMTHWDGLLTKPGEQILVLAATNRPFDLDEAIIRRFERRIMVGLPSAENREGILKTLLSKEKHENIDFKELAAMTEGYSGSDLKNLCMTAAYRPVRELLKQETMKEVERKKKAAQGQISEDTSNVNEDKNGQSIILRPLTMQDMRKAKNQVAASFAAEGSIMSELKQWNDSYGEGGSRKKEQLTYFL